MKKFKTFFRRRLLKVGLAIVLAWLVLPYIYSRITSPWRTVQIRNAATVDASDKQSSDATIRIVTYNIAHGRGLAESNWDGGDRAERRQRLDSIARLLRDQNADIVVLNEVDFDSSWSGHVNQAAFLAEHADFPYWAEQCNMDFRIGHWNWRFGNAILSKYPIQAAERIDMPGYSKLERIAIGQKQALRATIDHPSQSLRIIGVHLCQRSSSVRRQSAEGLVHMARQSPTMAIIAGDFNSSLPGSKGAYAERLDSEAIEEFLESGAFVCQPSKNSDDPTVKTFLSVEPDRTIDWIIVPNQAHFLDYRVLDTQLSDHRPILAEVKF